MTAPLASSQTDTWVDALYISCARYFVVPLEVCTVRDRYWVRIIAIASCLLFPLYNVYADDEGGFPAVPRNGAVLLSTIGPIRPIPPELKTLVENSHKALEQGVAFCIRLEKVEVGGIPVSETIMQQMERCRVIQGTISSKGCNIELYSNDGERICTLSRYARGFWNSLWNESTLTDREYEDGMCGYFPQCFDERSMRLWAMDVILGCVSPISLNSRGWIVICEKDGIDVLAKSPVAVEYGVLMNGVLREKIGVNFEEGRSACASIEPVVLPNECRKCSDGRRPAVRRAGKYWGQILSIGNECWVYDHARVTLFSGISFEARLVNVSGN